jgi:PAS domain S-box-containing protein
MKATVALAETAQVVSASLDLDEVLERILEQTMSTLDIEAASIALIDPESGMLEFKSALGEGADGIIGLRLEKGEGVAGWVAEKGESVIVADASSDPRFYPDVDEKTGYQTRAIACAPIQVQDETLGVLEAINPQRGSFDPHILEILMGIAGMAGTAIEHARLFAETQAARKRYAGLFEDSIDPILISDLAGVITDTNLRAQTFLGRTPADLVGTQVDQLHDQSLETPGPQLSHLVPGLAQSYETSLVHKDGTALPVEFHVKRMDQDDHRSFRTESVRWIKDRSDFNDLPRFTLTAGKYHLKSGSVEI